MAYWNGIRGVQEPIPIRKFDGVYKPDDEGFNLPDELFTELINFAPDNYPAISTRPGYSVVGQFGTAAVLGMGAWKDSELHCVFSDGTWRRLNGDGTWTQLATGLNTTAEWSWTNFKGNLTGINLIGANGIDTIKRYDGTTVQNLSGAPAGGNYIDTQANRLYCAVGNIVKYSALSKGTDWTTVDDAGEIAYETPNGENINGLSAGTGHVTVFKPSSTAELYGTGPTSYKLDTDVATDIGVTSNKAVTLHDAVVPFVSRDGIYQYSGGLRPSRSFSDAILRTVLSISAASAIKCVAGSDGERMYFGIPSNGAAQNNLILQYNVRTGGWYMWDGIAVTQMIRVGEKFYMGDATGRVLLIVGTTDIGTPITATAITKPFTSSSMARKQQWYKLWLSVSIPTGSSLSIYISGEPSGNNWTLCKTLTANTNMFYKQILVPTNSIANVNAVRLKIVATGPVQIHEITRQLRELPMR